MRVVVVLALLTRLAVAAPPEPSGPHPRMLLDAKLRAAWKTQAQGGRGPIAGAITLCSEDKGHEGALYMGAEWSKMLQACLVAWAATDDARHATTALHYFTALLDDLEKLGDGKGGDAAALRDSGYAIRNLAPYTALAYDWLHDAPGMTPALRSKARQRWAAWLAGFKEKGYHPRDPGSNYQAGYLLAATTVAIAQGGEAAEEAGPALWAYVVDELWGKDMARALAAGGALDGGDWSEGWQYGPLSVAEYALAARVAKAAGIPVDGVAPWLASLLRRHVHALSPSERMWVGGDFEAEQPYAEASVLTLAAVALGDARPEDRQYARGELARLKLVDQNYLVYDALATVGDPPRLVPRASWPTWYRAAATATLFTRTAWDDQAIWFVASCAPTSNLDHRSPNAGNFVLSRGAADLVVDPSPYGSLSTLTGNAPTVASAHLPPKYIPSQGAWGEAIAWRWATKTRSGVVAARCDYADAYRFQDRKTDVAEALRDFILLPSADGHDASLVILDRATTDDAARKMYLRFRVPGELALDAGTATARLAGATLTIHGLPAATLARPTLKDCFKDGTERGKCDAARFPVTDYRVELAGPAPRAVHVLDAAAAATPAPERLAADGYAGVLLAAPRPAVVIWPTRPGAFTYRAPKTATTHVVVDAPGAGAVNVATKATATACDVTITPGGPYAASPLILTLDAACAITADPEAALAADPKPAAPLRTKPRLQRGGCCGAQTTPGSPLVLAALVLGLVLRRRRAPRYSSSSGGSSLTPSLPAARGGSTSPGRVVTRSVAGAPGPPDSTR